MRPGNPRNLRNLRITPVVFGGRTRVSGAPCIKAVTALDTKRLRVLFENGVVKVYHCGRLLRRPESLLLKTPAFFRSVRVDAGGYGVVWNDDLDISEYELWTNGKAVRG